MSNQPFTLSQVRPIREAMTVSRPAHLGQEVPVTWFSLGAGTSITPESYDCTTLYLGGEGSGTFVLGDDSRAVAVCPGQLLAVPPKTLCGTRTAHPATPSSPPWRARPSSAMRARTMS